MVQVSPVGLVMVPVALYRWALSTVSKDGTITTTKNEPYPQDLVIIDF